MFPVETNKSFHGLPKRTNDSTNPESSLIPIHLDHFAKNLHDQSHK